MTAQEKDRIECAIRHIQTAVDVDPWAAEIAVEAMEKQIQIGELPSAQPEIIRCKDCRYKKLKGVDYYCDHITGEEIMVSPKDYCSWAERGTDG